MSRLRPSIPWFFLAPIPGGAIIADSGVTTDKIADCAVTSIKIADSAVGTGEIADCAITSIKIADSAVGTGEIADCSVTSDKIADSAVTNAEIADCSIGSSKIQDCGIATGDIADSAVSTVKILDCAVTPAKFQNITAARLLGRFNNVAGSMEEIALGANLSFDSDAGTLVASGVALADCSVTSAKIADSGVTTGDIADCAVTSVKIADSGVGTGEIADCAVTSAKIADSGVGSGEIADSAVTTIKIPDCAITYAKIQNVTAARLLGRKDVAAGAPEEIALSAELRFDTTNDWLEISDSGITNGLIADCSIGSTKIQDCGVATGDIADCAITNAKILDSAIYGNKIADCAITSAKIGDSQVGSNEIADSSVITAKIPDCGITYAKIQNVTAVRLLGRSDAAAGSPQEIALSAELRFDSGSDWLEIADCGILVGLLKDSSITNIKIADSAISNDKIADCGVRSTELADCATTNAKLADSAVYGIKLADSSVTAAKMSDSTLHTRVIQIHVTDTALAVGDTAATFFIPAEMNGYDLVSAQAAVKAVSTTGRPTIQIRNVTDAADMLVNKITLDSGEKTSFTSDTASSIDTANDSVATGNEIAIDIDSAGTAAEDLYVILSFKKP